jgi:hypothetical protein
MASILQGLGANYQPLQLGSFTFYQFEVPEDLPNLFGVQKLAVHDFSGGTRTVQELGSFPADGVEWHGVFFQGDTQSGTSVPIQRASLLNTMRVTGTVQRLIWGPFQYDVIVHEFEITGKMAQELQYRIKVVPTFDYTTTSNQPPSTTSPSAAVFNAQTGVTAAVTSTTGLLLPPIIIASATFVAQSATAAVISANGNVSSITNAQQTALQAQITAVQITLQPVINGSDYGQATAAATLSASLFTLSQTLMVNQVIPIATIVVSNPNLMQLASQYYGDSTLWPLIAQQNNLQDVLPIGLFTLTIPPTSIQTSLIPTS